MDKIRKKILETLILVPGTDKMRDNYVEIYSNDEKLFDIAEELYIAILTGIEGIIGWLDHSTYSKERHVSPIQYAR